MSLNVSPRLLEKARYGPVSDDEFVDCVRDSLPYAWGMVERLAKELEATDTPSVQNVEVPPDEASWGQVFRLVGSDAMRGAVERRFRVRLAFQNCCGRGGGRAPPPAPGAGAPGGAPMGGGAGPHPPPPTAEYAEFFSPRAQLLNQRPDLLNC